MNKAHELLNQASYIPTAEQIATLTEDEIPIALGKINTLKEMHYDNFDIWDQLDKLETKVHVQAIKLRREGSSNVG